jgi:capsular polysaccharide export protein
MHKSKYIQKHTSYAVSKTMIANTKDFLHLTYYTILDNFISKKGIFYGWGRKKSGLKAMSLAKKHHTSFVLLEDGFIRSLGLGVTGSPSFSLVKDDVGIYYDARVPSKLETILNTYDFKNDNTLMRTAKNAMALMVEHHVSKYNNAPLVDKLFLTRFGLEKEKSHKSKNILIIAQTAGDASLAYGMVDNVSTHEILKQAFEENPNAKIFLKIHPDVLTRKKSSDISVKDIPNRCIVIDEDVNPISLLKYMDKVYTKTSGMGMEALILGLEVVCYGIPYYAGWQIPNLQLKILETKKLSKDMLSRRKRKLTIEELFAGAYILYTQYYNPHTNKPSDIIDTIDTLVKVRTLYQKNEGTLFFFGFSYWKRQNILLFFPALKHNRFYFCSTLKDAQCKGLNEESKVFIWGKKPFDEVEIYVHQKNILLYRIEDGFVRSVSLGSDLTKAYSLVVDAKGIYFDPARESDLEYILSTYVFGDAILKRAKRLRTYLIKNKISKYNIQKEKQLFFKNVKKGQKILLVPGQVEDDASIIYGANKMTNLELLKASRINAPDAYIIYKPHPDVLVGNRKGNVYTSDALQYCNTIVVDASLDSILECCDEVHTMTSLAGFEALIRAKKVYTYGVPFYAGWGLTEDSEKCVRRIRKLTIDELVAATLILYPRYINPKTNKMCEIEVLLEEIEKEKNRYTTNMLYRLFINTRNTISRKLQVWLKVLIR